MELKKIISIFLVFLLVLSTVSAISTVAIIDSEETDGNLNKEILRANGSSITNLAELNEAYANGEIIIYVDGVELSVLGKESSANADLDIIGCYADHDVTGTYARDYNGAFALSNPETDVPEGTFIQISTGTNSDDYFSALDKSVYLIQTRHQLNRMYHPQGTTYTIINESISELDCSSTYIDVGGGQYWLTYGPEANGLTAKQYDFKLVFGEATNDYEIGINPQTGVITAPGIKLTKDHPDYNNSKSNFWWDDADCELWDGTGIYSDICLGPTSQTTCDEETEEIVEVNDEYGYWTYCGPKQLANTIVDFYRNIEVDYNYTTENNGTINVFGDYPTDTNYIVISIKDLNSNNVAEEWVLGTFAGTNYPGMNSDQTFILTKSTMNYLAKFPEISLYKINVYFRGSSANLLYHAILDFNDLNGLDLSAPTIDSFTANAENDSDGTVNVSFSAIDNNGINYYQIKIDDGNWIEIDSDQNTYQFTGIANGTYTVEFRAVDYAGNIADTNTSVTINFQAPTTTTGGGGGARSFTVNNNNNNNEQNEETAETDNTEVTGAETTPQNEADENQGEDTENNTNIDDTTAGDSPITGDFIAGANNTDNNNPITGLFSGLTSVGSVVFPWILLIIIIGLILFFVAKNKKN